jgi:hypothetical protein
MVQAFKIVITVGYREGYEAPTAEQIHVYMSEELNAASFPGIILGYKVEVDPLADETEFMKLLVAVAAWRGDQAVTDRDKPSMNNPPTKISYQNEPTDDLRALDSIAVLDWVLIDDIAMMVISQGIALVTLVAFTESGVINVELASTLRVKFIAPPTHMALEWREGR